MNLAYHFPIGSRFVHDGVEHFVVAHHDGGKGRRQPRLVAAFYTESGGVDVMSYPLSVAQTIVKKRDQDEHRRAAMGISAAAHQEQP